MELIPKFQKGGGGFESFFSIYTPGQTEQPRREQPLSRQSKSKEEDKGKLTEKDLFDMLEKLDGLPNEMQVMVRNMTTTLNNSKALGLDGIQNLANTYLRNLYSLKEAKYNKDYFDKAYQQAVTNKSLNEAAIDPSGNVWITNKSGELKAVSPEIWAKIRDSKEYQVVTNGNLLWMRSHMPQYVNNNQLLRIVENGIGLEEVHQMIKSRFQNLGKSETSTEFYVPKQAVKGHQILEQMLAYGPEGYYKITQELSQTEDAQVQAALAYIYSTLPSNAKTRLALETQDGSQKSVQNVINAMIFGTLDSKTKYSSQYAGTEGRGVTQDGKSIKSEEDNIATKLLKGLGAQEAFSINLGDEYSTIVNSNTLPLVGKDDKDLGVRKPVADIFYSSLGRILDTRSASIGGNIIPANEFNHVITEENKIRTIDFPSRRNDNGTVVPDLSVETREKKRAADAELRTMGINPYNPNDRATKYQIINQVYQKHKLSAPYNQDGSINSNYWTRFAILAVSADGRALKNADRSLLQEVTDDYEAEGIISAIQESVKNYTSTRDNWFGSDELYKGILWMPVIESYGLAMGPESTSEARSQQLDMYDQVITGKAQLTKKQVY